jgi:hypothetical protein
VKSKEEFNSQVQQVVERVYEDENLRRDLTDEEAQPMLDWFANTLYSRLENLYSSDVQEVDLEKESEVLYSSLRDTMQAVVVLVGKETQNGETPAEPTLPDLSAVNYAPPPETFPETTPPEQSSGNFIDSLGSFVRNLGTLISEQNRQTAAVSAENTGLLESPPQPYNIPPPSDGGGEAEVPGIPPERLQDLKQQFEGKSRQERIELVLGALQSEE